MSHTNSDDHRVYRSSEDIARMQMRDPVVAYSRVLLDRGELSTVGIQELQRTAETEVETAYGAAENELPPEPATACTELFGPSTAPGVEIPFALDDTEQTMVGALNTCLREALDSIPRLVIFGEDVEDPKGGVFGFTKGLSTRHPQRVINSPLAEATIVGIAAGLAATGFRPVFELQFIDFAAPAFNQLLNQVATLRWRSKSDWKCPAVFYAPCGAYLPAGSAWHSQSNEGIWTHIPGIRVAVPSTPLDLVGLLWTALHEEDPTLLLIPKHVMRVRHAVVPMRATGFGRARIVQSGDDVTAVAWGNCLEVVKEAADRLEGRCSVEIIDPVSLVPFDGAAIAASVAKTGRLVVISEDVGPATSDKR